MHAGVVVARLGGVAEPPHHLELTLAQIGGALAHLGLEVRVLPRDLLPRQRQRASERAEHPARRARVGGEHAVEVVLEHLDRLRGVHRDDRGQPRRLGQHGDLAEHVARPHPVEHQARVAAGPHDGEQAEAHDVQRVAGVVLVEDDVAWREAPAERAGGEVAQGVSG